MKRYEGPELLRRFYLRVFLASANGWVASALLRRFFARSEAHRAWLSGWRLSLRFYA